MTRFTVTGSFSETNNSQQHQHNVDNLYAWIDTIPLSRPKKNIARDFADGVLLAEVVFHFLPKFVDLHNYPAASSIASRKVNWDTLNRRVLLKMGMRVSDETISQLIDAKPGIIEQVLLEIQSKIEHMRQSGYFLSGKNSYVRSKSQGRGQSRGRGLSQSQPMSLQASKSRINPVASHAIPIRSNRSSFPNLGQAHTHASATGAPGTADSKIRTVSVPRKIHIQNQCHNFNHNPNPAGFKQGYVAPPNLNLNSNYPLPPFTAPTVAANAHNPPSNFQQNQSQCQSRPHQHLADVFELDQDQENQNEKFPAPWDTVEGFLNVRARSRQRHQNQLGVPMAMAMGTSARNHSNLNDNANNVNDLGSTSSRPSSIKSSLSERFEEPQPPNQIIYRGHKMVPLQLLDEKEREMKNLEAINRSLTLKIFRLETLVNIKDQRVEDLTHQIQSYRALYDTVADSAFASSKLQSSGTPTNNGTTTPIPANGDNNPQPQQQPHPTLSTLVPVASSNSNVGSNLANKEYK